MTRSRRRWDRGVVGAEATGAWLAVKEAGVRTKELDFCGLLERKLDSDSEASLTAAGFWPVGSGTTGLSWKTKDWTDEVSTMEDCLE